MTVATPDPRLSRPSFVGAMDEVRIRRSTRSRFGRIPLVLVIVATAAMIIVIGVAASPLLAVDEVVVIGGDATGEDLIVAAARVEPGDPIVGLDIDGAVSRIESLPWIASASVDRDFSGEVRITVTERVPVATADRAGRSMLIDREGRVLAPSTGTADLPSVGTLRPADGVGATVRDGQRHLTEILATLPTSVRSGLLMFVDDGGDLRALRTDGIMIELGDDSAIHAKFEAVERILSHYPDDTVTIVDVRVPNTAAVTTTLSVGA